MDMKTLAERAKKENLRTADARNETYLEIANQRLMDVKAKKAALGLTRGSDVCYMECSSSSDAKSFEVWCESKEIPCYNYCEDTVAFSDSWWALWNYLREM